MLESWVDTDRHPVDDATWRAECAHRLDTSGALVLPAFFLPRLVDSVLAQDAGREHEAFYARSTHNVWLTEPDADLPADDVRNRQVVSTKGLLADDQLAPDSPLRQVYDDPRFRRFVAGVVGVDAVYPYADRLSSINVHFHRHGEELGWHFDNSGFAVTALMQAPRSGGRFEYVTGARDSDRDIDDLVAVERVLDGDASVATLDFAPGDLVLFRGRDAMHRVTPSAGPRTRVLVVFAFNEQPGIALSESAMRTFYGRTV